MGKNETLRELANILAKALRHKIGSIVNLNEIYAKKYSKDADILMKEAVKVSLRENWNNYDKIKIKNELAKKLKEELKKKEFLGEEKFDVMDAEIGKALRFLNLSI